MPRERDTARREYQDEPKHSLEWGLQHAQPLLEANPDLKVLDQFRPQSQTLRRAAQELLPQLYQL
jgi:hypothetical protein